MYRGSDLGVSDRLWVISHQLRYVFSVVSLPEHSLGRRMTLGSGEK